MKKYSYLVTFAVIAVIIAVFGFLYFADYLDFAKPVIKLNPDISAIGKQKKIAIAFTDERSGLSQLAVEIVQDNKGQIVFSEAIPARGVKLKDAVLTIDTAALKLHDGPATINITAKDYALFKNEGIISQTIKIDTLPPQINLFSTINNVNQGGSCFVAYRISKPAMLTGIYVNNYFSPGFTIMIDNKPTTVAYFAIPSDAARSNTKITVFARDEAGNETTAALPFQLKEKKFRADKMNLSDNFLQQKMPEFQAMVPELQGKTPLEVFNYVNGKMRTDNFQVIQEICQKSAAKKFWDGTFLRMPKAKPMALFGDKRSYMVNNQIIAHSVHQGVDLASTASAPIEAANNGLVLFAAPLGIYGNCVIIDHGLGLLSLYSHLSVINTKPGKMVKKEEVIGHSGKTGLAGGDHLHFSILAGGQFVNPQEWWDPHWINDNISRKMIF